MSSNLKHCVLVVGGNNQIVTMFRHEGWRVLEHFDPTVVKHEVDLIQFAGGEDVTPGMYGEIALQTTKYNTQRDLFESGVFLCGVANRIPMAGICRGGQFLNVMNGGKMWQHVSGHQGRHKAKCLTFDKELSVTSTHHQMMIPAKGADVAVLMTANVCSERNSFGRMASGKDGQDVEAIFYGHSYSLCYQPHPEYVPFSDPLRRHYFDLIEEWLDLRQEIKEDKKVG